MNATTGKRGWAAVLAIGVRQQSAYQRKILAGKAHATQLIETTGERHLTRRHLENVCATGSVENVRSFEEARKRLAVLAVADEAKAGGWRNRAGDAAYTTTMASQQDACHLAFSTGCGQLRKVLREDAFGVCHTFWLRAKKVADWRLDRRH